MRVLFAYDPKLRLVAGTSRLISELLRRKRFDVEMFDLSQKEVSTLAEYDAVIAGGGVWFGSVTEGMTGFLLANRNELLIKPLFLWFHSHQSSVDFQESLARQVPLDVLEHAETFNLGLTVDEGSLSLLERLRWKLTSQRAESPDSAELLSGFVERVVEALY